MKIKKLFNLILVMIVGIFLISPATVFAKEELKKEESITISSKVVGTIYLYDDYTVVYDYEYVLKEIKIVVCPTGMCDGANPKINPGQIYLNGETVEFSIKEYVDFSSYDEYQIKATGMFKTSLDGIYNSTTLTYTIKNKTNDDPNSPTIDDPRFDDSVNNVLNFINMWVIPGIYIVLAITIVVKSIMLVIDLVKYSDNSDVRKEKLRGFVYIVIGVFAVAVVNSVAGIFTGFISLGDS